MPRSSKKNGRPPLYSKELAEAVCEAIADGKSIREITKINGMPSWPVIRSWIIQNKDGFATRYAHARDMAAYVMEEEILERAMAANDKDSAAAARVHVDALKWIMSKRAPKRYGDKLDLNHTGEVAVEGKGLSALLSAVKGKGEG